ncbi:alcohol dehydrogenase catalytic domain-containing protein [Flavisphingomonas formosensis]|uniref:alcohol dehydrogenase catalytic domain-containing protein n=1 Tax=Flavisphingomonas formosensis TaxID=861534 RepID=UPI0012F89518|nr:zinc-binding dehydrogenase [Sphingomonas formosensis]
MKQSFSKAIVQTGYGDRNVFEVQHLQVPPPGPREVRIRHTAVGVNFHDIYVRTGLYKILAIPGIPGIEAVGEITEVGSEVPAWRVGQRAAYVDRGYGAYCEERVVAENLLIAPPSILSDQVVATSLLRGLTAAMLLEQVYHVKDDDLCLIHAAAGSTGALLVPWARHLGARVVGTIGQRPLAPETAALCEHVYSYADAHWSEQALAEYGPHFQYICDSVGAPTLEGSLAVAARCGHVALFGQSGGMVEDIPVRALAAKSLSVTRPNVFDYLSDDERRRAMTRSFIVMVERQGLSLPEPVSLPLDKAGEAHKMLEERLTQAPIALIP